VIVSQLSGGLGNQMFQFAAAYALARRNKTPCVVDRSAFLNNTRSYELDRFVAAPNTADWRDVPILYSTHIRVPWRLRRFLPEWTLAGRRMRCFREAGPFAVDERFFALGPSTYLMGYYQCERYFQDCADEIRAAFSFARPPSDENARMMGQMAGRDSVAVHVRRGDYVAVPLYNSYHGVCGSDYYERAFGRISAKAADASFWVFSDDPEWARENIRPPGPAIYVSHNRGADSPEDLRLMAACRHQVIANSSFSWWAAWLNPWPGKVVVAPRRWVATTELEVKDLIPEAWIQE
jgi:Glycosyl transferase family 11